MLRIVADLGNSRLKWGPLDAHGQVGDVVAVPLDQESAWETAWTPQATAAAWAIASVNPPAAERLAEFLERQGVTRIDWFRSAAQVPVRHVLERVENAGTDRALAVLAAQVEQPAGVPGLVVLCGTAVTVERIRDDGTWQGGAIAAGLGLSARALHTLTAQLPLVAPRAAPPAWGPATIPALEAGIYWGVVGAIRELIDRQTAGFSQRPWIVWTGGDAPSLAPQIHWDGARVVPELVLRGLARVVTQPGGA